MSVAIVATLIPAPAFLFTLVVARSLRFSAGSGRIALIRLHETNFRIIFASILLGVVCIEMLSQYLRHEHVYHLPPIFWFHIVPATVLIVLLIPFFWFNGRSVSRQLHKILAYSAIASYALALALGVPLILDMWHTIGKT